MKPRSPIPSASSRFSINPTKASAFALLFILLVMIALAWWYTSQAVKERAQSQFERQTEAIATLIDKRLDTCIDMLSGIQGLFAASKSVERNEFNAYLESSLIFNRYPEISSVRFLKKVTRENKTAFIDSVRQDTSLAPEGYPNMSIFPEGNRESYIVVTYFEPHESDHGVIGHDALSDPARKTAYDRAMDFGEPTASAPIIPLQALEADNPNFFVTIPIYTNLLSHKTIKERRANLEGFVSVFFVVKNLMDETLQRYEAEYGFHIDLEIFDGIQPNKDNLIYDSNDSMDTRTFSGGPFSRKTILGIAGRNWLLSFNAHAPKFSGVYKWIPLVVVIVGVIISFLIFMILYTLSASQAQAERLARQMTKHLRESEERFRQLAESIDEVFWLTDPQTQEMLYVSKAYEKIWGRSMQSVYFKPNSFLESVHPEDQERVRQSVDHQRTQGSHEVEYRIIRPDGSMRWIRDRAFPIQNAEGKIYRVAGVAEDITEKKKAEENLRKTHERMGILAQATNDIIWDWDLSAQKVWWNDNLATTLKHTGVNTETDIQFRYDNIHPDDREKIVRDLHRVIREDKNLWSGEYRFRCGDGSYRMVYDRGIIIRDNTGNPLRMIGGMEDITERKKLESQLLQSQKMETVGTLAGGIAHDLNNQLTPVRGYLDMVLKEITEAHPAYSLLKEANTSATRCADIIHRLLNYSRPSTHHKKPFSMAHLFDEIRDLLPKVLPSTISVQMKCPQDIWITEGNDTEVQTVLMNLSANARDAMPEGGSLFLEARNVEMDAKKTKSGFEGGHYVLVTVQDSGTGISPENVDRIFDPFFSTKEKGRGTGLGLAMVFKIVKDHGGWIEVSSVLGSGTVFQIYLPAKPDQPSIQAPIQENPIQQVMGHGETILFADDEEPIRHLGRIFLEKLNYKPVLAVDGKNALEIYSQSPSSIHAVLMDMTMPKLTGRQTLQKILEVAPEAKIIITSGYTSEGLPDELIKSGAAAFLQKPYTLFSLGETLQKVLHS